MRQAWHQVGDAGAMTIESAYDFDLPEPWVAGRMQYSKNNNTGRFNQVENRKRETTGKLIGVCEFRKALLRRSGHRRDRAGGRQARHPAPPGGRRLTVIVCRLSQSNSTSRNRSAEGRLSISAWSASVIAESLTPIGLIQQQTITFCLAAASCGSSATLLSISKPLSATLR